MTARTPDAATEWTMKALESDRISVCITFN
jgi:hypothetical protein